MSVRTTIGIPKDLDETLRRKATDGKTSIRALVLNAMTGPPVPGRSKRGPLCPDKENPYDLVFA